MRSATPHPAPKADKAWKGALRKDVEESLRPMVDEAENTYERKLREADVFDIELLDKLEAGA